MRLTETDHLKQALARIPWASWVLPLLIVAAVVANRIYMNVRPDDPMPYRFVQYSPSVWRDATAPGGLVLVDVYASWCPTCKAQHKVLDSLLIHPRYAEVRGVRVDFDRDREYRQGHRITAQSTILVFRGAEEISRSTGVTRAEAIRDQLDRALAAVPDRRQW
jgi:thiol:disulfide interchange protein